MDTTQTAELAMRAVADQDWFVDAPMLVVLAARVERNFWKYRNHAKAYRALLLDAGHLSQSFYTLATDDSFPQVYHYYTTYLAQFRAYPSQPPYPPPQNWRTLEVQLNQAMQDPFIPGDMLRVTDKQVMLQVAETEAEPKTVIRYIITPVQAGQQQVAAK